MDCGDGVGGQMKSNLAPLASCGYLYKYGIL